MSLTLINSSFKKFSNDLLIAPHIQINMFLIALRKLVFLGEKQKQSFRNILNLRTGTLTNTRVQ